MANLKNQHFVPRCLLKPFTQDGEGKAINVYNIRHDKLIQNAPVKGQCARDYLYGKDGKIEELLSKIEGLFSETRRRVIEDGSNDEDDKAQLMFFTHLQSRRTAGAIARLKKQHELMNLGVFGQDGQAPAIPDEHELVMESLQFCLASTDKLQDLKVRIVENKTAVDFVISDDPAIFFNRFAAQKLGKASFGVGSSGVTFFMPISPKFGIICYDGLVYTMPDLTNDRVVLNDQNAIEALNELQHLKAAENVYFKDWEDREYVRAQFLAQKDNRPDEWSTLTYWMHDGKDGDGNDTYREGTAEEARQPGARFLIKMSYTYPNPLHWFTPLKYRSKPKSFHDGSAIGHVRKKEWLRKQQA